jgi:nucleoside-diphosphate-sugar epimerase
LNIVLTQTRLGATGFIGGDLLAGLQEQYPEYEITCLVRTQDKADTIRAVYPDVKVVLGDDESAEIVERETMNADIVFRECRFETGSYT